MTLTYPDMQTPFSLIPFQQSCIDEILALPEQGRRAASFGFTLLNRPCRSLRRIKKAHHSRLLKRRYSQALIDASWLDICDMAKLEVLP